ncbi:aminodeoxychorismate/anthranilate synthase component II [Desulfovibrio sp. JC010]|uniref:aminodeoxychorismate/anthranilate synthase component II n=1 Tax=Desulfovibrio sp. JC010 TaxID=2593641 RepID=UPI0013D6F4B3|nr:aminodeoxychorismate/anthranilate synthase component II [Desulfovibrio sp. JC010]NDV25061.1 aminodeoxychorismate/anthranilate synthase component II [Desulfovibrio sp. JC010]
MNILLIDNNDSFTNNLEHLLAREIAGARIEVRPYAQVLGSGEGVDFSPYQLIIISPGPGCPADYPGYEAVIESGLPVLGVCLGMQIINEYFGGRTARLDGCFHGRTECIDFDGKKMAVARYHSLYCSELGQGVRVLSKNSAEVPMAAAHESLPLLGYQFHPESFLTEQPGVFIAYALHHFGLL